MTVLMRVTAVWSGFVGSPGYTSFVSQVQDPPSTFAQTFTAAVRQFFVTTSGNLPIRAHINVSPTYVLFNDEDGSAISEGTVNPTPQVVDGTDAVAAPGQSGYSISWLTTGFIAGRRVRGRTFMVPMSGCYEADGTLALATIQTATQAAVDLRTAVPGLSVWSRPYAGRTTPLPAKPARVGSSHLVTGSLVKDHAATLRSRYN